jgi:hypothetical protein
MLPGPSVERLAQPTSVGVRLTSVLGRQTLALDVPATDVVLDLTLSRNVSGQLTFRAPLELLPAKDQDPLANKGQRLHVTSLLEIEGHPYEVDRGWYQIESWEEEDDAVSVTALDLLRTLETDPMRWPSSPPRGSTLRTELQRLAGNMPVRLDAKDRVIDTQIQWDRDRVKSIRDLCQTHGLAYSIKTDGYLHVWEHQDGRDPVATYSSEDLLLEAPRTSGERLPNRFLAVGSTGGDENQTRWHQEAELTFPPYGDGYGVVREIIEVQSATSQAMVDRAANRALSDSLIAAGRRPLQIVLDPRLELGDIVNLIPREGEPFVGRVGAISMPLTDPGAQMRVDVEEVLW